MHTLETQFTRFHYNSDLSGDVLIQRLSPIGEKFEQVEFSVNGQCLLDLVAEYIRSQRIAKIEEMEIEELLQ